jgi:hypothetical protein
VETWVATIRFGRRLTERLSGFAIVSYFDQQNKGGLASTNAVQSQDRYEVGIGLTYTFRPIRL